MGLMSDGGREVVVAGRRTKTRAAPPPPTHFVALILAANLVNNLFSAYLFSAWSRWQKPLITVIPLLREPVVTRCGSAIRKKGVTVAPGASFYKQSRSNLSACW